MISTSDKLGLPECLPIARSWNTFGAPEYTENTRFLHSFILSVPDHFPFCIEKRVKRLPTNKPRTSLKLVELVICMARANHPSFHEVSRTRA